jgi:hypothetical protein
LCEVSMKEGKEEEEEEEEKGRGGSVQPPTYL